MDATQAAGHTTNGEPGTHQRDGESPTDLVDKTLAALCRSVVSVATDSGRPLHRVSVRFGDASLEVEWSSGTGAELADHRPPDEPDAGAQPESGEIVRAPLVGTFYCAREPGASPFVTEGMVVEAGQQVGIVEAMKLMNSVVAEQRGRVAKILAGDAEPVEFGQPLIVLEPVDEGAES